MARAWEGVWVRAPALAGVRAAPVRAVIAHFIHGLVVALALAAFFPANAATPQVSAGGNFTLSLQADGTIWAWGENGFGQLADGTSTGRLIPGQVGTASDWKAVAAGASHAVALKSDGTLWTWGRNNVGQQGDGTTTTRRTPVQMLMPAGPQTWKAIAAGSNHTLAIRSDDTLWAWGENPYGQLGNGTNTTCAPILCPGSTTPVQVGGPSMWKAVAAGFSHTLAIRSDNTLWAWGENSYGQVGDGTSTGCGAFPCPARTSPVQVGTEANWRAVAAGHYHSVAIRNSADTLEGELWTWGRNEQGQLGDGTTTNRLSPVQVGNATNWTAVTAGTFHSAALRNGTLWTWGDNSSGQLGDGTTTGRTSPGQVAGNWAAVDAGFIYSAALGSDGIVRAWGANFAGQLGDGTTTDRPAPVQIAVAVGPFSFPTKTNLAPGTLVVSDPATISVSGLNASVSIAGGEYSINGGTYTSAAGAISNGQSVTVRTTAGATFHNTKSATLTIGSVSAAFEVSTLRHPIAGGHHHTVVLKPDGVLWAAGRNDAGQLGNGGTAPSNTLVPVNGFTSTRAVAAGGSHTVVLKADGTVWAWGENASGQLGNGGTTTSSVPVQVNGLTGVVAVAAGTSHSLAVKSDGTVWAWGKNEFGQLGNGGTANSSVPVQVSGLTGVQAVAGGDRHSATLKADGTVWTWGDNSLGQLGTGNTVSSAVPVSTGLVTGVAIAAGGFNTAVLVSDGTVWTWGDNTYAQLGNTVLKDPGVRVRVQFLTAVVAIAVGFSHMLALKADGTLWAWGDNREGQLGDATAFGRNLPVAVSGQSSVVIIAAGRDHSLALQTDGSMWGWGSNFYGQLGDGGSGIMTATSRSAPAPVPVLGAAGAALPDLNPDYYSFPGVGATLSAVATSAPRTITGMTASASISVSGGEYSIDGGAYTTAPGMISNGQTVTVRNTLVDSFGDNCTYLVIGNTQACFLVSRPSPQLALAKPIPGIVAGPHYSIALKSDGSLDAWGVNFSGQLGDGTTTDRFTASAISGIPAMNDIAAGSGHVLAAATDGSLWSWGSNVLGQLGDGTTDSRTTPQQAVPVSISENETGRFLTVAAGSFHSLAVTTSGVWAWGSNGSGELGNGDNGVRTTPFPVSGIGDAKSVAAGDSFSLLMKTDGKVWAWGANSSGQLGNGTVINRNVPVQVLNLNSIIAIAAGRAHALALRYDGTVWAWGANGSGQLGDGTMVARLLPVQVASLSGVKAISASGDRSVALREDGTVVVWGSNEFGAAGNGTTGNILTPVASPGFGSASVIAAGHAHTLALRPDGSVWAAGRNDLGQVGDNTAVNRPNPVRVLGPGGAGYLYVPDTRPDTLGSGRTRVEPGSTVNLDPFVITGINTPAAISISGSNGKVSVNGGPFTSDVQIVTAGQTVQVQLAAQPAQPEAQAYCATTTTTLVVGGYMAILAVQTRHEEPIRVCAVCTRCQVSPPQSISQGESSTQRAEVSITTLDFGYQPLNATGPARSITLQNTGTAELTGIAVDRIGDAGFTHANGCGPSLGAGLSCTVNISFSPTVAGPRTAAVAVRSSAGALIVSLTGAGGNAPAVELSRTAVNFGNHNVGVPSGASIVRFTNTGNLAFTTSGINVSGDFSQANDCDGVRDPGESCTMAIVFTPTQPGARSGTLTIQTTAPGSPHTVSLSGAGGPPTAPLEPGFNLVGNSLDTTLDVVAAFGCQDAPVAGVTEKVITVWKWNAALGRWEFYSPQLPCAGNAAYAAIHNYGVLSTIGPGEGYWVNALEPLTLPTQSGAPFAWNAGNFGNLVSGFNLIAGGNGMTPSAFNAAVNATPPAPGVVPTENFVTLWAWDAALAKWYFYSPLLEASGGLPAVKAYADSHNYLHFQDPPAKTLGEGTGFWVNRP